MTQNLGDVCEVIGGGTPSKKRPEFFQGNIPWATVRDMRHDEISNTEFKITVDAVASSSTNVISAPSVIIATRVGLGKVCLINRDTAINQDLRAVVPINAEKLDWRYLFWWFKNVASVIIENGTGATVQGVKLPFIKSLQIPLPPLAEQTRIVAVLDEVFEGVAVALANTEKNLANARELFESYLSSTFTKKGKGWEEKPLGDVCDVIGGGTPSKGNPAFYSGNILWATVRDMKQEIISDTELKITKEAIKASSTNLIPKGNVIIATRVGLGKVCFLAKDTAINQDLRGIVPYSAKNIDVRFLFWWFKNISPLIVKEGTGATVQGVKLPFIKTLLVPIPSLSEQKCIVEQLDAVQESTRHLENIYHQKIEALKELKQSLLQKAFSGELMADTAEVKISKAVA